jgi:hypothetical protein
MVYHHKREPVHITLFSLLIASKIHAAAKHVLAKSAHKIHRKLKIYYCYYYYYY